VPIQDEAGRRRFATEAPAAGHRSPKSGSQEKRELVAARGSNVGKLAGAIAAQVRGHGVAVLSAVGPEACYNALKATIIAGSYLEDTHGGKLLAAEPSVRLMTGAFTDAHGVKQDVWATILHVQPVVAPLLPEAPEIFVATDTNVGLMAGLLTQILENAPTATVAGMGAQAISKALKAGLICQKYMAEKLEPKREAVACVPRLDTFREHNDEERVRMLLSIIRVRSAQEQKLPSATAVPSASEATGGPSS